jgi:hypothetical protein
VHKSDSDEDHSSQTKLIRLSILLGSAALLTQFDGVTSIDHNPTIAAHKVLILWLISHAIQVDGIAIESFDANGVKSIKACT